MPQHHHKRQLEPHQFQHHRCAYRLRDLMEQACNNMETRVIMRRLTLAQEGFRHLSRTDLPWGLKKQVLELWFTRQKQLWMALPLLHPVTQDGVGLLRDMRTKAMNDAKQTTPKKTRA